MHFVNTKRQAILFSSLLETANSINSLFTKFTNQPSPGKHTSRTFMKFKIETLKRNCSSIMKNVKQLHFFSGPIFSPFDLESPHAYVPFALFSLYPVSASCLQRTFRKTSCISLLRKHIFTTKSLKWFAMRVKVPQNFESFACFDVCVCFGGGVCFGLFVCLFVFVRLFV